VLAYNRWAYCVCGWHLEYRCSAHRFSQIVGEDELFDCPATITQMPLLGECAG